MKKIFLFGIVLQVLCIGCSKKKPSVKIPKQYQSLKNLRAYSVSNQQPDTVRLQRQQTYGHSGKALIGKIRDITVDHAGRVYIADSKQWNIKVFRPDGSYIKTLGRSGRGPGEFVDIIFIQIQNNHLYAFDNRLKRAVIFSLDSLQYSHAIKMARNKNSIKQISSSHLDHYWVQNDHKFLMRFIKNVSKPMKKHYHRGGKILYKGYYYFMNTKGEISSNKLFAMPFRYSVFRPVGKGMVGFPTDLYGQSLITTGAKNNIYAAWSDHFLIKVYNSEGNYQRAIYYPYHKAELSPKSLYSKFGRKTVHKMDVPKTWPALNSMKIDSQNQLWVSTIVKNKKVYQWWVLKPNGKLIARFRWPRSKPIELIKNGSVYTKEKTKKGVPQVVRYKIQMQ